jgi:hypothetical protein
MTELAPRTELDIPRHAQMYLGGQARLDELIVHQELSGPRMVVTFAA